MANIQNYLNQIKTAVFGKDVRESIHDAIKQCYDDASINHDNANMEVKLARGSHNTLNDRLDENEKKQENLSSQLDKKANKSEFIKKGYGTLNDFDEKTRQAILENNNIDINYVLGDDNVLANNIKNNEVLITKLDSDLKSSIEGLSGYETLTPVIIEGYFYNRYTYEKEAYQGFKCCDIHVKEGQIFEITFSSWGSSMAPILIKDNNGNKVFSMYDGTEQSTKVERIEIPKNSTTLHISSSNEIIIKKMSYFSKVSVEQEKKLTLENLPDAVLKRISTKDFGTISEGVVCFVDDDGFASLLTNTKSIIEEYQIPMTFSLWSWCEVMADDKRETLKTLINNFNCEVALHTTGPMTNKSEDEITSLIESEMSTFKTLLNIDLKSYVYGYNASDNLLRAVASNYFNICASGGYTINNKRTNIFEMNRIWVDDSKSLQDYKNIIDSAKNNKQAVIFFWHSNELNDITRLQLVKDVVAYAKSSSIKITTLNGLYNTN
nr:MAG TPA: hypothetical protein [Caudoviricetes sp.]